MSVLAVLFKLSYHDVFSLSWLTVRQQGRGRNSGQLMLFESVEKKIKAGHILCVTVHLSS